MTNQEFVDKINTEYQTSNNLLEGNGGYNIIRGTAHPVSGYMEDLFALYIAEKINDPSYQFLVDKLLSIRLNANGRATTFKPDLTVINRDIVLEYFDLKTNLGWSRDLKEYLTKKDELINKINGKDGWIHFSKNDNQNVIFSKELIYKIVVFNGWNINPKQLADNVEFADNLQHVELFILNRWNIQTGELVIDNNAFEKLIKTR